jgi:hypothetical protein
MCAILAVPMTTLTWRQRLDRVWLYGVAFVAISFGVMVWWFARK